jgi:pimeloyl-ACP methyl ester carboxylesterase
MSFGSHRDVTASGVRLRVAEYGEGPTMLCVHGLFFDHTTWSGVAHALGDQFQVVALDLPGFGESEKPSPTRFPYGVDSFTEAVADLYAGLDLGRAAVVGHGVGGAVALTLAARHPELVSQLVLVDALCYETSRGLERQLALVPFLGSFVFRQVWGRTAFRTFFRERLLSPGATVSTERIDYFYDLFNTPAARGSALATLRATTDSRGVVAQTGRITTPTLVVWGRSDKVFPAGFGQRLAREIHGCGFQLLDTGHSPQEERPDELARVIRRFLQDERPSLV